MNKTHILPTTIAVVIGAAGILLLLYAWHLPPFAPAQPTTENAYVRGKVTALAPQLSGYIAEVAVSDFQAVKKGDLIARIDDRIYRQKLAQAEASLATAEAALQVARQTIRSGEAVQIADEAGVEAARSALASAETDLHRATELSARGVSSETAKQQADLSVQKAISAMRQAEAQRDVQIQSIETARTQVSAREADIANANAAVELARLDLANTEIHAPEDGRLGQVAARVGQYVPAGTSLVSHVGHDVWIIANFPETGLRGMRLGQPVHIKVDAMGGREFHGRVEALSPATASEFSLLSASNATGNFTKIAQRLPVRISVDPGQDMSELLAPGLSVIVSVETGA